MKRVYRCPHCRAVLNPSVKIILRGQVRGHAGLLLISPQPGTYEVVIPEGFPMRKGDTIKLFCPACSADLTSRYDRNLAEISVTTGMQTATVAFSRIYGQHATYFITHEQVKSYGEHASPAKVNFWGEGPGPHHS